MQCDSTSPLSRETDAPETIVKLECDIDDASPEVLAYAADRLREAGAREVHWLPLYCKKGRPSWQLQVICAHEDIERLQTIIFLETTTNGIRRQVMERVCLPRRFERVTTHGARCPSRWPPCPTAASVQRPSTRTAPVSPASTMCRSSALCRQHKPRHCDLSNTVGDAPHPPHQPHRKDPP